MKYWLVCTHEEAAHWGNLDGVDAVKENIKEGSLTQVICSYEVPLVWISVEQAAMPQSNKFSRLNKECDTSEGASECPVCD